MRIYFLGPRDVFSFFTENGSQSLTAGIQAYFARKIANDVAFRDAFSIRGHRLGQHRRSQVHAGTETTWGKNETGLPALLRPASKRQLQPRQPRRMGHPAPRQRGTACGERR